MEVATINGVAPPPPKVIVIRLSIEEELKFRYPPPEWATEHQIND